MNKERQVINLAQELIGADYNAVLEIAVEKGAGIAEAAKCCIVIFNKRKEFVLKAGFPKNDHGINQKITTEYGAVFLEEIMNYYKKTVTVINPCGDPRTHYLKPMIEGLIECHRVQSIVFSPLFYKKESLGVMIFDFTTKDFIKTAEIIKEISGIVGAAMGSSYERKKKEEKSLQRERLHLLGENSARVAHVVRNAAVIISGFTKRLAKIAKGADLNGCLHKEKLTETTSWITKEVEKLEGVMENILNFSCFSPNKLRLENYNASKFLRESVESLEGGYHKTVKLHFRPDNHDSTVYLDKNLITACLNDFIRNAREAGAKNVWIRTKIKGRIKRLLITLTNDGEEIRSEILTEIFDPFFTTKSGGSGLGLSNVKMIIQSHGGDVIAESRKKRTIFKIYLPI
ncbi:MAG: ATP-binding protein [Patescibacteria group bacterium]